MEGLHVSSWCQQYVVESFFPNLDSTSTVLASRFECFSPSPCKSHAGRLVDSDTKAQYEGSKVHVVTGPVPVRSLLSNTLGGCTIVLYHWFQHPQEQLHGSGTMIGISFLVRASEI